jgi:hypothetical protein
VAPAELLTDTAELCAGVGMVCACAWAIAEAALTRPVWLNAWGKLPSSAGGRVDRLFQQADIVGVGRGAVEGGLRPVEREA